MHEVAPLSDQVKVADAPSTMEVALSDIVGAGGGGGVTVNETEVGGEVPNVLLQTRVKVCVVSEVAVNCSLPLVASAPLQPLPDAVQPVAKLDDQVRVVELPSGTLVADSASEGAGGGLPTLRLTEAVPVAPVAFVQVSVYVLVPAAVGVMRKLPLGFSGPVHAPDPVHDEASIVDQVSVVVAPTATEFCDKLRLGVASAASAWMNP